MKVQCDVCEKAQATILCCADEASLCEECDTRVHAANKLANKHQRVPLLYPSPEDLPCCDICQEKTGYFFCLEDRALLCRNCDYSIHSKNALAANHKRFLVSGLRVGLQAITVNEVSDSIQACSPLQVSSPTTQVSQLSSPTTQVSQLSSPRNTRPQKSPRITSVATTSAGLVVQEIASPIMNGTRDGASSKLPLPPPVKQEQLHSQQHVMLTLPRQNLQNMSSTGVFPSKIVGPSVTSLPPTSSLSQQFNFNVGKQFSEWGMHNDVIQNPQDYGKGEMFTQRGGGGSMRRGSVSEYLTESIPGWKVDELLNLPEMDAIYNFTDSGVPKTDAASDVDWSVECSVSDNSEGMGEAVAAEVPSMPSPPTASGIPRLAKPWGFGKPLREPDLEFFLHCDDQLVVPDIGGVSSPIDLSPSSLPQKRRRTVFEF